MATLASNGSVSDVNAKIAAANAGDTVTVPAGTFNWNGAAISINKAITLQGVGTNSTIISGGDHYVYLHLVASGTIRLTGIRFDGGNNQVILIEVENLFSGLIDHCYFIGGAASEMIHNYGSWSTNGNSPGNGWDTDVIPGSINMLVVEDCQFDMFGYTAPTNGYQQGTSAIQSYYGARTCVRHCQLNFCQIDQHGTPGMVGARWWEIYNNANYVPSNSAGEASYMQLRAGSGLIYNNTVGGPLASQGLYVSLFEEDSGTNALFIIGTGLNEKYSPAYLWNNDSHCTIGSGSSNVIQGTNFFVSTNQPATMIRCQSAADGNGINSNWYVPLAYPHPLISSVPIPATIASNGSAADVNAKCAAANPGDTVTVPVGTFNWGSGVSFGNGVILKGLGGGTTPSGRGAFATSTTIITGITVNAIIEMNGSSNGNLPTRFTGFYLSGGSNQIITMESNGLGAMLIDNCTWEGGDASEMIHFMGTSSGNNNGWTDNITPGSAAGMVVVENCTFNKNPAVDQYFWGTSAMQGYYGCRVTVRACIFNYCQIDMHGGATTNNAGARWYEIYNNTYFTPSQGNQSNYITLRAGSGFIYNNQVTGGPNLGGGSMEFYSDWTNSPPNYGPGAGIAANGQPLNNTNSPVYVWNNTGFAIGSGSSNVSSGTNFIVISSTTIPTNMRVYQTTAGSISNFPYTPLVYPHPAIGGVTPPPPDTTAPSVPTALAVTSTTSAAISLSWKESTDNVSSATQIRYLIQRRTGTGGFSTISSPNVPGTGTGTVTYIDAAGLSPSTTFIYQIQAFDAAGNASAFSATVSGTTTAAGTLLPANRTIDWTTVGIIGGVPSANWPIFQTISPSGTADDSVTIQTAINNCPVGQVVLLTAGVFNMHRSSTVGFGHADDYATGCFECGLYLTKGVVLRGAGPNKTQINYGDGANIISMGTTYLSSSAVVFINITQGASKLSTSLTLANTTNLKAGSYIVVTQKSDTPPLLDTDGNPLVNSSGYGLSNSAMGHDMPNNCMVQINRITAISGLVVTLETPLYLDFTNSPQVYLLPNVVEKAGIEMIRFTCTAGNIVQEFKNINLESAMSCWVIGCESDWCTDRSHIYLSDCYRCEIRNNYMVEGFSHNSGQNYAIFTEFRASHCLIENNIIRLARHPQVSVGCSGNVWAYNYNIDAYMGEYHNSLPENDTHGAHPFMNLWEGNTHINFEFDFAHGSSSHNTVFRCYINLTTTNPDTNQPMTGSVWGMTLAMFNTYMNILGNVIGIPGKLTAYQVKADATQSPAAWKLGYYDDGGTTIASGATASGITLAAATAASNKTESTMLRGGNYDAFTGTVVWADNIPSGGSLAASYLVRAVIPTSMYRSAIPSFFTATKAVWPPNDPAATTRVNKLPAQLCYEAQNLKATVGGGFDPTYYNIATGGGTTSQSGVGSKAALSKSASRVLRGAKANLK